MTLDVDESEHSLEMQFPLLAFHLLKQGCLGKVKIVPIMIGALTSTTMMAAAKFLSQYIKDESNSFVISSDFCHWGRRFGYTLYLNDTNQLEDAVLKYKRRGGPTSPKIYESISNLDHIGMKIIETKSSDDFSEYLKTTQNTICGRYPIELIMKSMECANFSERFKFISYAQSSHVELVTDSSVSYATATA